MYSTSAADWVGATAAVVAALTTGGAFVVAALAYRRQGEQRRRGQARRVYVIRENDLAFVINNSDEPVYLVQVHFRDAAESDAEARYPKRIADTTEDFIEPGSRAQFTSRAISDLDLWHSAIAEVEFTDSAGVRWTRGRFGTLSEVRRGR